jgi:hypothetical protein
LTKITGPVIAWMIWMNASASHFAFSGGVRCDEPEQDADRDRDQDPGRLLA